MTQADEQLLHQIQNELINQRQKHHHRISQSMIVGNVPLAEIKNRTHSISPMTPDVFLAMKPEIDYAGYPYSGIVKADHTLLTVDAVNHEAFQTMLNAVSAKPVLKDELKANGFSEHQIELLDITIAAYAAHGQDEFISFYLDKRLSDAQLLEMAELMQSYITQSEVERILDKNGLLLKLCQKQAAYKRELDFYEEFADTDFSSEQKQHLFEANQQGISTDTLAYAFDSSYAVEEIDAMAAQIQAGDMEAIQALQEKHVQALIQVTAPAQIPDTAMTAQMHSIEADSKRDVPLEHVHALTTPAAEEPAPQNTYEIFRLIENDSITREYRFEPLDSLQKRGLSVKPEHYESVYTGSMLEDTTLDSIYEAFNLHHPEDFTGYSLSVGDIIVLNQGESRKAMFVDSIGFTELPDFFLEKVAEKSVAQPDLDSLPFSDKSKGVIGNTAFRYISGKTYHKLDTDSVLMIAARLAAQETPFSAKVGKHGTTTITVPASAEEAYQEAAEAVKQQLVAEINARCFVGTSQSEKTSYFILPDKPLTMDSLRELKATGNLSEHTIICAAVSYLSDEQQRQEGIIFKKFGRDLPFQEEKPTVAALQEALHNQVKLHQTEEAQIAELQSEARVSEMLTQAAVMAETSASQESDPDIDNLAIGDHIEVSGKQWAITDIQDDFSIHLKNLDPNDIQAVQAIYGHWKEQLTYTLLPEKGIPEEPVKRRGRSHRKAEEVQPEQMALGAEPVAASPDFFSEYVDLLRDNAMESGAVHHAALHSDTENTKLEIQDELQKAVTALLMESPEQYGALYQAFMDSAMQQAERTEAARKIAAAAGIPFSETPYNGLEDEINPFVYDGSMTPEDFRKMQTEMLRDEVHAEQEELPEDVQHFLHDDITAAAVKAQLAWDEIEDLRHWFYGDRTGAKPLENAIYGHGLHETQLAELVNRMQTGENVDRELLAGIFDNHGNANFSIEITNAEHLTLSSTQTDRGVKFVYTPFGSKDTWEREIPYEELGTELHKLVRDEYERLYGESIDTPEKQPEELPEPPHTPIYSADGVLLEADSVQQFDDAVKEGKTVSLFGLSQAMEKEKAAAQMPLDNEPDLEPTADAGEPDRHNYRIASDSLVTGGAKTKFQNNVAALRLLNTLTLENRLATPQEQETLAKYVGWGGLPQAFDAYNTQWTAEYQELQALLPPEEYDAARSSTLNAHYTSPVVIDAMFTALQQMGFDGGRVLEPAMGTGNFFGTMPEAMQRNSQLFGVELDSVTGRIAKQLYQDADIQVTGFGKTRFTNDSFDVAVGNVPFGSYKALDSDYDKLNFNIHDYFFAKSLDNVSVNYG